jgi:DNA-binding beta-propeller fold protein YncE
MKARIHKRATVLIVVMITITAASTQMRADTGTCEGASVTLPFTDVPAANTFFCSIAEAFFSGLSNGTDATHYSPSANVPREQMAAFVTRTMDQSLKRGSRRAALRQFWTPPSAAGLGLTTVGSFPVFVISDGADLWVANNDGDSVSRVRASDGKLLQTWTDAISAVSVLPARGLIFVAGFLDPGTLYEIDPSQTAGAVTTLPISLGNSPRGIAFDGERVWTSNGGLAVSRAGASVSIVSLNPLSVSDITTGFTSPQFILYDGKNMWVTDRGDGTSAGNLFKLDSNGVILQTVTVGTSPNCAVFDGTNIWVPNGVSNTVTVVRASTGIALATLSGNGLIGPGSAAFDGERVLVTNFGGNSVSLWQASDLSPLGSVSTGSATGPSRACSDGINFWIPLATTGKLARF